MKISNMKKLFSLFAALLLLNACVQDDDYGIPPYESYICSDEWTPTLTINDLYTMVDATGGIIDFEGQDQYFEGYVASSDQTGNFFKTISVQDHPENPTRGLQVEMDRANLFNNFPLGSKIRVKLNGLQVGYDRGALKVGQTYVQNGETRVGRMADIIISDHVKRACQDIVEIKPVVFPNIQAALNSGKINTLIKIENVQFAANQLGTTYANAVNQTTVNKTVEDPNGTTVVLRNSGFATFAADLLPEGSGDLTAILGIFDTNGSISNSDFQLFIRDTNDVEFNNPRFGDDPGSGTGPIGGNNATYVNCLNEMFTSYDVNDKEFDKFFNYAYEGGRYWEVKEFGGNKYIQMSAHNSQDPINSTFFIVPVNFSEADSFSFKTKDGYNNGNVLSVYYATNYTIGANIDDLNLVDITSSFTISTGNTNGYGNDFVNSGDYSLASLSGNGAILFKYSGVAGQNTTTMQIDDIKITNNDDPNCGNGGGGTDPDPNPEPGTGGLLFAGADFENWNAFLNGLTSHGLKSYATQSAGTGIDGSASLKIFTTPTTTTTNDYVFTSLAPAGLPANLNKITFYMKGSSEKTVSLNVYKNDGTYYVFNLGSLTGNTTLQTAANNQYTGTINTNNEWVLITLDLTGITDLNTTDTSASLFALKIGREANYDLHFDNFMFD